MPIEDCERLTDGLLLQPVNALSSLAFVLVGIGVGAVVSRRIGRQHRGWSFGVVLILVGLGSVAFHGPGGSPADWAHDASITALLFLVIAVELGDRLRWESRQELIVWGTATAVITGVEALWPPMADVVNAVLAGLAVIVIVGARWGSPIARVRPGVAVGLVLLAVGALVMVLSRSGGPWCDPDSFLQGHAAWHGLAALGLGSYAISVSVAASG
jgi:hypothetical protein